MRSVAKGNYIKGKGGIRHALAHVRYLQLRGGDDKDHCLGGRRLFFNANRDAISGSEVNEHINKQSEMGVVIHRVVLSPGLEGVDIDAYTRAVMSELQRSKGQDIDYYATKHRNTDHVHTHVVIMGLDKYNKQVRMSRNNYQTVREAGDRYIERHHQYSRYLDKDLHLLMRDGYKRDRGDLHFERLLEDFKSENSIEECDAKRRAAPPSFIKEFAIHALPESERIVRGNIVYTKYSALKDLLDLDEKLRSKRVEFLPRDQYQQLWSWIGNKKQFGDDYYERTDEATRLQQLFDEDLKRSLREDNAPPKSFRQYIFESRGRLLEWHEKYTIETQRSQLQKEISAIDKSGSDDAKYRSGLVEQLDWLNVLSQERIESRLEIPKIQRSKEEDKSMHANFAKQKNLSEIEERERWGSELVERAWKKLFGDDSETYDKASPQGRIAIEEALGREISKSTAEDHQHYKDVQEIEELKYESELNLTAWKNVTAGYMHEYLRPEIGEHVNKLVDEECERIHAQSILHLTPEERNNWGKNHDDSWHQGYSETLASHAYGQLFDHRIWHLDEIDPKFQQEFVSRWQTEIVRLRDKDEHSPKLSDGLQPAQSDDEAEPTVKLEDANEEQEKPDSQQNKLKRNEQIERKSSPYFSDRSPDQVVSESAPSVELETPDVEDQQYIFDPSWDIDPRTQNHRPISRTDRQFDSIGEIGSKNINNNKEARHDQLRENAQSRHATSDENYSKINELIFGDGPSITVSQGEKSQIEDQIELWQKIAFDSEPGKESAQEDQLRGGTSSNHFRDSDRSHEEMQSLDQIMQQEVQQNLQSQIQNRFLNNQEHSPSQALTAPTKENNEREVDRDDEGSSRSR